MNSFGITLLQVAWRMVEKSCELLSSLCCLGPSNLLLFRAGSCLCWLFHFEALVLATPFYMLLGPCPLPGGEITH